MSTARDELLDRFEAAWQRFRTAGPPAERPTIDAFLPADPALCQEVLPGLVEIDFECRLKAKEDLRVEHYFQPGRFPELAGRCALVARLADAERLFRRGGRPSRQELLDRFPHCRAEFESLIADSHCSRASSVRPFRSKTLASGSASSARPSATSLP
jgi:hypothetical protein